MGARQAVVCRGLAGRRPRALGLCRRDCHTWSWHVRGRIKLGTPHPTTLAFVFGGHVVSKRGLTRRRHAPTACDHRLQPLMNHCEDLPLSRRDPLVFVMVKMNHSVWIKLRKSKIPVLVFCKQSAEGRTNSLTLFTILNL